MSTATMNNTAVSPEPHHQSLPPPSCSSSNSTSTPTQTNPNKPKAVIFDLLTALFDSWSVWNTAALSPQLGHAWRKRYLDLTYACGAYQPYEDLVLRAAQSTPGLPPTAAAELLQTESDSSSSSSSSSYWNHLTPWPEAPAVLRDLQRAGYKLGIMGNCSTKLGQGAAARCADMCGVEFDAVVMAEEAGFYKPDPRAYGMVLDRLGVRADEVVFVAGSANDVPGASAAGMRTVWHNRVGLRKKEGAVEPEKEARTLYDVLDGVVL